MVRLTLLRLLCLANGVWAAAYLMLAPPASAMTVQTTLSVSATVAATCTVGSPEPVLGGATVAVSCSRGAPYVMVVDGGATVGGMAQQTPATRKAVLAGSAREQGGTVVSGMGTGAPQVVPVYVPATHSLVTAGLDARSVIATLIY